MKHVQIGLAALSVAAFGAFGATSAFAQLGVAGQTGVQPNIPAMVTPSATAPPIAAPPVAAPAPTAVGGVKADAAAPGVKTTGKAGVVVAVPVAAGGASVVAPGAAAGATAETKPDATAVALATRARAELPLGASFVGAEGAALGTIAKVRTNAAGKITSVWVKSADAGGKIHKVAASALHFKDGAVVSTYTQASFSALAH